MAQLTNSNHKMKSVKLDGIAAVHEAIARAQYAALLEYEAPLWFVAQDRRTRREPNYHRDQRN